jgi:hypothetical protein
MSGNLTLSRTLSTSVIFFKKPDLSGSIHLEGQTPAVIFLPTCNLSHIPGSLDPVASPAEDLEVIPCPLVTSHGDGPDVVQDVVMMDMRITLCVGFMDHLPAPDTLPTLLIADPPSHFRDRGPLFIPVLHGAGSLAADGMLVSRIEVYSLTTTMGTGTGHDISSTGQSFPYPGQS